MKSSPSTSCNTSLEFSPDQFRLLLKIIPQLSTRWHSIKKIHNKEPDNKHTIDDPVWKEVDLMSKQQPNTTHYLLKFIKGNI